MDNWVGYTNGNYRVMLNTKTGTKIRENNLDFLDAEFPESFDLKICNRCNMGCLMCHENSTPDGALGDIMNAKFIDSLHPYTELAIGGGNPLEHPDLYEFLQKCKSLKLIPSMTVHQKHFMDNIAFMQKLRDEELIYGIGISVNHVYPELIEEIKAFPNAVIHLINGMVTRQDLEELRYNDLKILILGYKYFRRGANHYDACSSQIQNRKAMLYELLPVMKMNNWFNTISFDNLAIKQLDPKRLLSDSEWEQFYMGDDGIDGEMTSASMFIDLVENKFAKNSCAVERFPLKDNITDMFNILRGR